MPGTGFSPTLTCSFWWQARHYHPHRHHHCFHHEHQHPPLASGWWWQFRPSSIFLALLSRCLWPVLDTRSLSTAETLATSRANGRRQSASATLRWRSTQPVTTTCSARTVNRTQGAQHLRLCPHSLCSSSSSSRELFEECPHPKGSIGVQSCYFFKVKVVLSQPLSKQLSRVLHSKLTKLSKILFPSSIADKSMSTDNNA